tara:strand:- start:192 stop:557 length:366 start_codon:yes stop_codon:yes gene_type:complete
LRGDFVSDEINLSNALLLVGRDVEVYWATGAGKSLVYQLPPLHTGKVALVCSPLISLMQDQCHRLNNTVGASRGNYHLACFLGSAQSDFQVWVEREIKKKFGITIKTQYHMVICRYAHGVY